MSDGKENLNNEAQIEVELADGDADILVSMYVRNNLTKESSEVFIQSLDDTDDIKAAIFNAILNESIINVLQDRITREVIAASKKVLDK